MIPTEKITSLERLRELAIEKRSITTNWASPHFKCKPAAFVLNMTGSIIQKMFDCGMYVYKKEEKK
jgi:hypothetical protein